MTCLLNGHSQHPRPSSRTEWRPAFSCVPFLGTRRHEVEGSLRLRADQQTKGALAQWKRWSVLLAAILILAMPAAAHVGSPDVFLEGNAGPYRLFVTVRVPQVIPGIAQIDIRSESPGIRQLRVAPMQLTGPGSHYPPTPDVAEQSKTDPQFFTGSLWLMEFGSLQVRIDADGDLGKGELAVPVPAVAQSLLPMQKPLGIALFLLMLLLALAMVSIVAAAVREGNIEPGVAPARPNLRRARIAAAVASLAVIAVLWVGRSWWNSDARRYAGNVYRPPEIQGVIEPGGRLVLRQDTGKVAQGNPRRPAEKIAFDRLLPDHDHLMHLFLLRMPAMDSFWHLHPQQMPDGSFSEDLPAIPPGHYRMFADVVLANGFPMTLTGQIDVPELPNRSPSGDDSGTLANPLAPAASYAPDTTNVPGTASQTTASLADGGRMIWERPTGPLQSNVPIMFRFRVENDQDQPATDLEPYMGMAAHAAIVKSDASVFVHLHPSGSVSMAAFEIAQAGLPGALPDSSGMANMNGMSGMANISGMAMLAATAAKFGPDISFPYGFPKPGLYRIFVQVKRSGQIQTGIFEASVE